LREPQTVYTAYPCTVWLMNHDGASVVSLGVRGDLGQTPEGRTTCRVHEFATLPDGREVALLEDRGWTTSEAPYEISLTHIVRNIYTSVLPDDAVDTGEEHEWQRFVQRLRETGVAVTPDDLRTLPYRIAVLVPSGIAQWKVT
jgi:hypothetical protein